MVKVQMVASYICKRYKETFHQTIDEMKLHKLLYFTQREAIVQTGEPMFSERFVAWKYGPVMEKIRTLYKNGWLTTMPSQEDIEYYQPVFDTVFKIYAPRDSWSLSMLSHDEYSWIKARNGCERLSSNPQNRTAIKSVMNIQNPGLVDYLHGSAWDEDINGNNAFYLINVSSTNSRPRGLKARHLIGQSVRAVIL